MLIEISYVDSSVTMTGTFGSARRRPVIASAPALDSSQSLLKESRGKDAPFYLQAECFLAKKRQHLSTSFLAGSPLKDFRHNPPH